MKKYKIYFFTILVFAIVNLVLLGLLRYQLYGGKKLNKFGYILNKYSQYLFLLKDSYNWLLGRNPQKILLSYRQEIKYDSSFIDRGYLLASYYSTTYNQCIIQLIRIYNNKIIKTWIPPIKEIFNAHNSDISNLNVKYVRFLHPLLLNDSSLILKIQDGPFFKLGVDSKIQWINNGIFHHSTEIDGEGNLWVPSTCDNSKYSTIINENFQDNLINKFTTDGKLIFQKSVSDILVENGYRGLLFGTSVIDADGETLISDPIHLNEIKPALSSTKFWNKGDLLISIRNKSTVFLYRPKTNKIMWLRTGPWLNQHSPDFLDSTRIIILGNDVVRSFGIGGFFLFNKCNNIYIYNFEKNEIDTPYSNILKENKIKTLEEGRVNLLQNEDVFIEETDNGNLYRLNKTKVLWKLFFPIDTNSLSLTSWCRYLGNNEK